LLEGTIRRLKNKMDIMYGYAACVIIGGMLGWWMWRNQRQGKQDKIAKIPYAGPVMDYNSWLPTTQHGWNIMIQKAILVLYVAMACYMYSFMWALVPVLVLYHLEWRTE
jgi:hypothetical protein